MFRFYFVSFICFILQILIVLGMPADGQYNSGLNRGQYRHDPNEGGYKSDNSGRYVHVHVPYNGGYGDNGLPYDHLENPYKDDPFNQQYFNDPVPKIIREYGAPLFNARN